MNIIDDFLLEFYLERKIESILNEILNETGTSIISRNKISKRKAYAGKSALAICKEKNPGLYSKYIRYHDLYMKYKTMITTRYKAAAKQEAYKTIK